MVKETSRNRGILYVYEECGLRYRDRGMAEKCEAWCKNYGSCNLEITSHAVEFEKNPE